MPRKTSIKEVKMVMGNPSFIAGVIVVGVIFIAGAVFIGKSDSGEINVTEVIQNSNVANSAAGGDVSQHVDTVPETFKNMTNGGLVPQENQPEPVVVEQNPEANSGVVSTTTTEGETAPQSEENIIDTTENGE